MESDPLLQYERRVRSIRRHLKLMGVMGWGPGEDLALYGLSRAELHGSGEDPLDLESLCDCFRHSIETGKPLPENLLLELLVEIERLRSGRDSELFKKAKPQFQHPSLAQLEQAAISYVAIHRRTKNDKSPVKTIQSASQVARQTFYAWERKYQPIIPDENELLQSASTAVTVTARAATSAM
jgi:hypothetical protein